MGGEGNGEEDPLELKWLRLLRGRRQGLPKVRLGWGSLHTQQSREEGRVQRDLEGPG